MPPDQPRPEVKPTREHEEAAIQWASSVMTGTPILRIYEIQQLAALLASRDAVSEERGRLLERERLAPVLEAFTLARTYVGCGDNSCLFVKPSGMATNGGCRCVECGTGRPFVTAALAGIYKAVAALAAQPKESATPVAAEAPALERPCHDCIPAFPDPKCERCSGSGKEPR